MTTPNTDGRFDHDGDWLAKEFFSPANLWLTPEEYAARYGHEWGCFSFHSHRYRDTELGRWVQRVGEILSDDDELERCRHLTAEEQAAVGHRVADGF